MHSIIWLSHDLRLANTSQKGFIARLHDKASQCSLAVPNGRHTFASHFIDPVG
jgi:hypothetical protein